MYLDAKGAGAGGHDENRVDVDQGLHVRRRAIVRLCLLL